MNIGLYQSAASLSALERWQDAVAQNITSAQTDGFRKRTVEFSSEAAGKWNVDPGSQAGSGDEVQALFTKTTSGINFITGETEPTGRDLDVAIQGQGFFEVKQPDGTHAVTRSGDFHVRPDRTLVTAGNCEVLTENGSPITLTPDGGNVTINQDGTVAQGSTLLGKLAVQKFSNPSALMPSAGGLFIPGAGAGMTPVDKPELMQGYLEQSNVQPLREMVDLVVISRAYEANQKIITTTDDQMQKTLDALG
ncbi:MAG TPA: flagellar hook-basal body protein [Candidatus Didemnitutus sp.]|jgi:flagellar basal body rod protein FlgG